MINRLKGLGNPPFQRFLQLFIHSLIYPVQAGLIIPAQPVQMLGVGLLHTLQHLQYAGLNTTKIAGKPRQLFRHSPALLFLLIAQARSQLSHRAQGGFILPGRLLQQHFTLPGRALLPNLQPATQLGQLLPHFHIICIIRRAQAPPKQRQLQKHYQQAAAQG